MGGKFVMFRFAATVIFIVSLTFRRIFHITFTRLFFCGGFAGKFVNDSS